MENFTSIPNSLEFKIKIGLYVRSGSVIPLAKQLSFGRDITS